MPYIFIIFLLYLFNLSSILKSDNIKFNYITLSENNLPGSRLLIDRQKEKIEKKVKEKKKNESEKINKKKPKNKKKSILQNNHKFKVNFIREEIKPSAEEMKFFYDNLVKLNKKSSITIVGYANKTEALFLRSLLLKENFNINKIYVKALGHDNELEGNKDIVVITNN